MGQIAVNPIISTSERGGVFIGYLQTGAEPLAMFACLGNPNGAIQAGRGSMAFDVLTGDVYIKTSGYASNNNWNPIAASGGIFTVTQLLVNGGAGPNPIEVLSTVQATGMAIRGNNSPIYGIFNTQAALGQFEFGMASGAAAFSSAAGPGDVVLRHSSQASGNGFVIIEMGNPTLVNELLLSYGPPNSDVVRQVFDEDYIELRIGAASVTTGAGNAVRFSARDVAASAEFFVTNEQNEQIQLTGLAAILGTQFDKTADTTLADIPVFSVPVLNGRRYSFRAHLMLNAAAAGGAKVAFNRSGTGSIRASAIMSTAANIATGVGITNATAIVGSTAAFLVADIEGWFDPTSDQTLSIQFAQNAASGVSSVLVGSSLILTPIS